MQNQVLKDIRSLEYLGTLIGTLFGIHQCPTYEPPEQLDLGVEVNIKGFF